MSEQTERADAERIRNTLKCDLMYYNSRKRKTTEVKGLIRLCECLDMAVEAMDEYECDYHPDEGRVLAHKCLADIRKKLEGGS